MNANSQVVSVAMGEIEEIKIINKLMIKETVDDYIVKVFENHHKEGVKKSSQVHEEKFVSYDEVKFQDSIVPANKFRLCKQSKMKHKADTSQVVAKAKKDVLQRRVQDKSYQTRGRVSF
ncbi:hypothetical protein ACLOJK_023020 [Asimina triloba]